MLYIPVKPKELILDPQNEFIGIDLGVRTFVTGIGDKTTVRIGDGFNNKLFNLIKRKHKIKNNDKIPQHIKDKNEFLINKKIKNNVNELHWKTIKFLITNYKNIFIGKLNVKSIVSGSISPIMKDLIHSLSFYKFRTRLENKCDGHNINMKVINEMYKFIHLNVVRDVQIEKLI